VDQVMKPFVAMTQDALDKLQDDLALVRSFGEETRNEISKKVDLRNFKVVEAHVRPLQGLSAKEVLGKLHMCREESEQTQAAVEGIREQTRALKADMARDADLQKLTVDVTAIRDGMSALALEHKDNQQKAFASNQFSQYQISDMQVKYEEQRVALAEKASTSDILDLEMRMRKAEGALHTYEGGSLLSGVSPDYFSPPLKRMICVMEDRIMRMERRFEEKEFRLLGADHDDDKKAMAKEPSVTSLSSQRTSSTTLQRQVDMLWQCIHRLQRFEQNHLELAKELSINVTDTAEGGTGGGTSTVNLAQMQTMLCAAAKQLMGAGTGVTQEVLDRALQDFHRDVTGSGRSSKSLQPLAVSPLDALSNAGSGMKSGSMVSSARPQKLPAITSTRNYNQILGDDAQEGFEDPDGESCRRSPVDSMDIACAPPSMNWTAHSPKTAARARNLAMPTGWRTVRGSNVADADLQVAPESKSGKVINPKGVNLSARGFGTRRPPSKEPERDT